MIAALLALALLAPVTPDNPDAFDRAMFNATETVDATRLVPAVRLNPPVIVDQADPPVPPGFGLHGLPYAPVGMERGDRVAFYRAQFGLPSSFQYIAYRESRYFNTVRTYCCYGWYQLYIMSHLNDHRSGPRLREECEVFGVSDIFGVLPSQEQKNTCAAAVLYSIVGFDPWA